jgi:hypothetical protein
VNKQCDGYNVEFIIKHLARLAFFRLSISYTKYVSGSGKMEMVIDFPGGAKADAHFGPYTVSTDQPLAGGGEAPSQPLLIYF